jgi:hypothetical protein
VRFEVEGGREMAFRSETWGERDSRRWRWWIAVLFLASVVLGIVRLAFGIGGNLLLYSLAMLFLLFMPIAVPVVVIGLVALVVDGLGRLSRLLGLR